MSGSLFPDIRIRYLGGYMTAPEGLRLTPQSLEVDARTLARRLQELVGTLAPHEQIRLETFWNRENHPNHPPEVRLAQAPPQNPESITFTRGASEASLIVGARRILQSYHAMNGVNLQPDPWAPVNEEPGPARTGSVHHFTPLS